MTHIETTGNYRQDLAQARQAGLKFRHAPNTGWLYNRIAEHNGCTVSELNLPATYRTVFGKQLAAWDNELAAESHDLSTLPDERFTHDSYIHTHSHELDNLTTSIYGVFDEGSQVISHDPDVISNDDMTVVDDSISIYANPAIVGLIALVMVYLAARQLVKLIFHAINRLEQYRKASEPVDYFGGIDNLFETLPEAW